MLSTQSCSVNNSRGGYLWVLMCVPDPDPVLVRAIDHGLIHAHSHVRGGRGLCFAGQVHRIHRVRRVRQVRQILALVAASSHVAAARTRQQVAPAGSLRLSRARCAWAALRNQWGRLRKHRQLLSRSHPSAQHGLPSSETLLYAPIASRALCLLEYTTSAVPRERPDLS